ncbi:DEAD/DEAH box helicase family protein [Kitasatospora sp. NPDC096128]|uniref:DEAD/DEAH box helicase family protein n=1 Tax=Kitasatospora sp. NPDC096128 TaxID=3155547 RepID=UPI003330277F
MTNPRTYAGLTLWPEQDEAVTKACKMLAHDPRVVTLMPCGSGKTVTGGAIAQELVDPHTGSVLITVPTLQLVAQTLTQWLWAFGPDALGEVVALCSDPHVLDQYNRGTSGIQARILSDARELAALKATGRRITAVCTYQSLHEVIAAHRAGADAWGLVIIDELHRADGNTRSSRSACLMRHDAGHDSSAGPGKRWCSRSLGDQHVSKAA